jgi:hypothetical protein
MSVWSRVELYAATRRDYRAGASMRSHQRKYHVAFETVQAAVESAWPAQRKDLARVVRAWMCSSRWSMSGCARI